MTPGTFRSSRKSYACPVFSDIAHKIGVSCHISLNYKGPLQQKNCMQ